MKLVSMAALLEQHGPCTSPELREKSGFTAKGIPTSALLYRLFGAKHASKKKVKGHDGFVYALTASGKKWLNSHRDTVETVPEIEASLASSLPATTKAPAIKMTTQNAMAVEVISSIMKAGAEHIQVLRNVHTTIGVYLAQLDAQEEELKNGK